MHSMYEMAKRDGGVVGYSIPAKCTWRERPHDTGPPGASVTLPHDASMSPELAASPPIALAYLVPEDCS